MFKGRILIVDDEPLNLESLKEDLEDAQHTVITAIDGDKAWEILSKDKNFDVIMLDRMMPNMSGDELLNHLQKDNKLKHISVIMQTAEGNIKRIMESYEDGCYWYLQKPFGTKFMLEIVDKAITRTKTNLRKAK